MCNHPNPPAGFTETDGVWVGTWNPIFSGNTAIMLNGEQVAIWNVGEEKQPPTDEKLFSGIVHEMFHGYQHNRNDDRWANELLLVTYPFTEDNVGMRIREHELLVQAVFASDEDLEQHFVDFVSVRYWRTKHIGEHMNYELAQESMEGTATYVQLQALHEQTALPLEYLAAKLGRTLAGEPVELSSLRHSFYPAGLYLCLLLDRLVGKWKVEYEQSNQYLYDFLISKVPTQPQEAAIPVGSQAKRWVAYHDCKVKEQFSEFYHQEGYQVVLVGDLKLTGFDPMNVVVKGSELLHTNIIKFTFGGKEVFLTSQVLTRHGTELTDVLEIRFFLKSPPFEDGLINLPGVGEFDGFLRLVDGIFYFYSKDTVA